MTHCQITKMSNIRQRKQASDFDHHHAQNDKADIPGDELQPALGWNTFFRVAVFVFVVLPAMVVLRLIFLVDSPINPVHFSLPPAPKLEGPLAANDFLKRQGRKYYEGKVQGPESIVYQHGHIYTGTADGKILHITHSTGDIEVIATLGKPPCGSTEYEHRCGRPLGMRFDSDGYLIVADAYLGLHKINVATGDVFQLFPGTMKVDGRRMMLMNDLDIASDGMIYFTDSSRFQRRKFPHALLEAQRDGRLLRHDPVKNTTETLLDDLVFANGVQLARDGSYVLVAETTLCRIQKYHLKGPKAGQAEIFAENLPGLIDNIRLTSSGGYWVVTSICRHADKFNLHDFLAPYPWIRNQMAKIPLSYLTMLLPKCVILMELNKNGDIVRSLMDLNGETFTWTSEVEDDAGTLYLGSFKSPYIGVVSTHKSPK